MIGSCCAYDDEVVNLTPNNNWVEASPHFVHSFGRRARFSLLNYENEDLVFALREETAVQPVVGSIVWAFRRLESPETSARNNARFSVGLKLSDFFSSS